MKRIVLSAVAAAVVATGSFLALSARAGDAPQGPPPAQKKIEHPFLKANVGDWAIETSMTDESGKEHTGKATSKVVLGIGDTALVETYSGEMMGMPFAGHGVYKATDDGKGVRGWWFDSFSPEPMAFTGTLTDTVLDMSGTCPHGTMHIVSTKVDGGFDWVGTLDGKPWLSQKIRKAK